MGYKICKFTGGFRNISNNLTITTKIDMSSANLKEEAKKKGWWNGSEPFNFAEVYSTSGHACDQPRQKEGENLLKKFASGSMWTIPTWKNFQKNFSHIFLLKIPSNLQT